jgi:tRNA A-37 threonylcarbamoyl transferase component Bud32
MKQPPGEKPGPERPGVELPGYDLLEELGRGGMGVVYKARHRLMNRLVAVKLILGRRVGRPEAGRRFLQEIRAVAKLRHPNVVLAHDAGQAGDGLYLVMEYVEGTDLRGLLQRHGPLPVEQACAYVRQAALGLQHAWEHGLVHRDVKPGNLLVSRAGVVKVSDFGLVCLRGTAPLGAPESTLTPENAVLGTPAYMAPEQVLDPRSTDCRADLYSLGCTLYLLLAGRTPFPQEGMDLIAAHLSHEPEPIERLRPDVPAGVAAVVRRLLAKKPGQRYQTPGELAEVLAPLCGSAADKAASTVSQAAATRSTVTFRRRKKPVPLIGVLCGVLALACVAVAVAAWRAHSAPSVSDGPPSQGDPPGQVAAKTPGPSEPESAARAALSAQGAFLEPDEPGTLVRRVYLGPRVTDETLKHLPALPDLQELAFNQDVTRVTNDGLAPLAQLRMLRSLDIGNLDWLSDDGLRHLSGLRNLQTLQIHNTHVGDAGMAHLKDLTRLNTLYLYNTMVTDRGLAHLHGLRNLSTLHLKGLTLSDEAVNALRRALPKVHIDGR